MNTFLRQNWFKIGLLIIVVIIAGGAFYWFQWRPFQIRKECAKILIESDISTDEFQAGLDYCIKAYGLRE